MRHQESGIKRHQLNDDGDSFDCCLCIASGGALIMPPYEDCRDSAIGLAMRAFWKMGRELSHDPTVRIVVIRADQSTAKCRSNGEQFPSVVEDRNQSSLIKGLTTEWAINDLDDVVQQRPKRRRYSYLEPCKLRHHDGIYGEPGDDLHFRRDIGIAAGDELIKAARRTGLGFYARPSSSRDDMLLVLAAGWNTEFNEEVWGKAEQVALAELCALNGHCLSTVKHKMRDLLRRADADLHKFMRQSIGDIEKYFGSGNAHERFEHHAQELHSAKWRGAGDIKWLAWNAAWATANERKGYDSSAARDGADYHYNMLKQQRVRHADDIKKLVWAAAWHTANSRKGYTQDALNDYRKFIAAADRISDAGVPGAFHIKWLAMNAGWAAASCRFG